MDDDFHNRFSHIAPSGKRAVVISYGPEISTDDRPWNKHVDLRMLQVDGGTAKVIVNMYGGRGTINVSSR